MRPCVRESVCPCPLGLTSSAPGALGPGWGLLLRLLSGTFFLPFFSVLLFCSFFTSCGAAGPGRASSRAGSGPVPRLCPAPAAALPRRGHPAPGWGCPCAPRSPARRRNLPHPHFPRSLQLRGEASYTCYGRGMRRGYLRPRRCSRKFPSSWRKRSEGERCYFRDKEFSASIALLAGGKQR